MIRHEVKRLGIQCFHDAEPGIAHQMMLDYGLVRPGELVVGNDSHTLSYGAVNAGATGISRADMFYVLLFGELWFQVPSSIKVVLDGRQPDYPIAKDIILYLAGRNFGCGSSRPGLVLREVGVAAIVAETVSRLFLRNSIARAVPIFMVPGIERGRTIRRIHGTRIV